MGACNFCPGSSGGGGGGGGGGGANCTFLTLSACGSLTHERVFTPGTGLTAIDNGAGNTYVLKVGPNIPLTGANNAVFISWGDGQNVAVSAANTGRIRFDAATETMQYSQNGGAWTDFAPPGGPVGICSPATANQVAYFSAATTVCHNANFVFDPTNIRLGIGTGSNPPSVTLHATARDAVTNTVTDVGYFEHASSGAPAANFGSAIVLRGDNAANTMSDMGRVAGVWTTSTAGSEASALDFYTRTAGAALTRTARLTGGLQASGRVTFQLGDPAAAHADSRLVVGTSYFDQLFTGGLDVATLSGQDKLNFAIGGVVEGGIDNSGNFLLGTGALLTTANGPFPCIPEMPGPPTGNPASVIGGMAPIVIDQTDQRFYWYQNQGVAGWYFVAAGSNISGTGVNHQVTLWSGTQTINGSANLTFSGSLLTVVGGITQNTGAVGLTANGASSFTTSAGALTFTAAAASTWSTAAGGLTITSAAAATWSTAAGALTITSAAAATWSTAAGNLTIDAAAFLNLGTGTATKVQIAASGINVAIGGAGSFGAGTGVLFIASDTLDPSSNPVGGGIFYVTAGVLNYRGTSGTITTIADA